MLRRAFALALFSFALFLQVPDAEAAVQRTFVSSRGNDANPCTLALPCRGFSAAIAQTALGGEVIVLDSAGYGPVTVAKSVSLISPPGVYAGLTVSGGDGVTVDAIGSTVVLRGLSINGQGGNIGINVVQVGRLQIEGCTISNMASNGIASYAAGSEIVIVDTTIRDNGGTGIGVAADAVVVLDHVRSVRNQFDGFYMTGSTGAATATLTNSAFVGNGNNGVWATSAGSDSSTLAVVVDHSTLADNGGFGLLADTASGPVSITAASDIIQRNGDDGIRIFSSSAVPNSNDTVLANITDNAIQRNGGAGIRCGATGNNPSLYAARNSLLFNEVRDFQNAGGCFFVTYLNNTGTHNNTASITSASGF